MSTSPTSQHRSRPLRVESNDHLWFVTTRTIDALFWLHPMLTSGMRPPNRKARRMLEAMEGRFDKRLAKLVERANERLGPYQAPLTVESAKRLMKGAVGSALARAQERFGVLIFALVVLSNHLHMVLRTTRKNLAAFMAYVKARITENINHVTGRRGPLWARRYDAQPILDDNAAAGRVGYTLCNPLKANLVDDFEEWPGMNLAYGVGDDELTFEYLDRVAWHRKHRPADVSPFFMTATLTLSPIPSCEGMSREAYRASVMAWVDDALAKTRAREPSSTRPPTLGVEKVMQADFSAGPKSPARSRRPYAFGSTEAVSEHRRGMLELIDGYRRSSESYRSGQRTVSFPEGMYPPPILQAA